MQKLVLENNAVLGLVATIFVLVVLLVVAAVLAYFYAVNTSAKITFIVNTVKDLHNRVSSELPNMAGFVPSEPSNTAGYAPSSNSSMYRAGRSGL
jgi:Mg2+/Co2+ transporter CorB